MVSLNDSQLEILNNQLLSGARCMRPGCADVECHIGQLWLEHVADRLELLRYDTSASLDNSSHTILQCISDHADICDEIKCPVPYCEFFTENSTGDFEKDSKKLIKRFAKHAQRLTAPEDKDGSFIKFCKDITESSLQEEVHWTALHFKDYSKQTALARACFANSKLPQQWIVKRMKLDKAHLALISTKLPYKCHTHILDHLWAVQYASTMLLAMSFEGDSLLLHIDNDPGQFSWSNISYYTLQICDALTWLHSRHNTLYLAWTASNFILSNNCVKLCDFSLATQHCKHTHEKGSGAASGDDEDCDTICEELSDKMSPACIPPELYADSDSRHLTPWCDVWGVGCIMYHMVRHTPLYHRYRHMDNVAARAEIENCNSNGTKTEIEKMSSPLASHARELIAQCLQVDHTARLRLADLVTHLKRSKSKAL